MNSAQELGLPVPALLLSARCELLFREPFCIFRVKDYLPRAVYERLRESFPDDRHMTAGADGKRFFGSRDSPARFTEFRRSNPAWNALFAVFESRHFIRSVRTALFDDLAKARSEVMRKRWLVLPPGQLRRLCRPIGNWPPVNRKIELVSTDFQFSSLDPGVSIAPHTDVPRKLVSIMLYFPDPEWEGALGGGTEFYRPLDDKLESNWENTNVEFEQVTKFFRADFQANHLVGFVKSASSYHGVPAIDSPRRIPRRSLNVFINTLTA